MIRIGQHLFGLLIRLLEHGIFCNTSVFRLENNLHIFNKYNNMLPAIVVLAISTTTAGDAARWSYSTKSSLGYSLYYPVYINESPVKFGTDVPDVTRNKKTD